MKNDLTVSGVYIAALIGAGFSSGSEIVHYFAANGKWGVVGIFMASVLFGVFAFGTAQRALSAGTVAILLYPVEREHRNACCCVFHCFV